MGVDLLCKAGPLPGLFHAKSQVSITSLLHSSSGGRSWSAGATIFIQHAAICLPHCPPVYAESVDWRGIPRREHRVSYLIGRATSSGRYTLRRPSQGSPPRRSGWPHRRQRYFFVSAPGCTGARSGVSNEVVGRAIGRGCSPARSRSRSDPYPIQTNPDPIQTQIQPPSMTVVRVSTEAALQKATRPCVHRRSSRRSRRALYPQALARRPTADGRAAEEQHRPGR